MRTIRLPDDRYRRIYVVRKAGPRGGHTVAGEVETRKDARAAGAGSKVKADTQPEYKMKPKGVNVRGTKR